MNACVFINYHRAVCGALIRFTRDLNLSTTTHLIVNEAQGAKYEAAASAVAAASSAGGAPTLQIVHASWIEECWNRGQMVDCQRHGVIEPKTTSIDDFNDTVSQIASETSKGVDLERDLDQLLASGSCLQSDHAWTFSSCHCLLAGFMDPMDENDSMVQDRSSVHGKLCRLLRRHMGTIYWEWNDVNATALTHVIVPDHCMDETTRYVTSRARYDMHFRVVRLTIAEFVCALQNDNDQSSQGIWVGRRVAAMGRRLVSPRQTLAHFVSVSSQVAAYHPVSDCTSSKGRTREQ
jgi:hypothetical protein